MALKLKDGYGAYAYSLRPAGGGAHGPGEGTDAYRDEVPGISVMIAANIRKFVHFSRKKRLTHMGGCNIIPDFQS